jgi:hypothetical protein
MNRLAGFTILLFVTLLLIISSVSVKVTAQGNDSGSEKSTTAPKTCSPDVFKDNPGLYATCVALAHNKESAASAEKPGETGTIIISPIEIKKGTTLTSELQIKKPATSSNPVSENCLQTKTRSGNSLCLTIGSNANVAYETGTKKGDEAFAKCESAGKCGTYSTTSYAKGKPNGHTKVEVFVNPAIYSSSYTGACPSFVGSDLKQCQAGFEAGWNDSIKKLEGSQGKSKPEGPVVPCKGPAGTNNGISSSWLGRNEVNGKCVPVT